MLSLPLANRMLTTGNKAFVMGIVNCTPDSFFPDSRGGTELALKLIEDGADILDIGGESSRPGTQYVDEKTELERIIPVIEAVRKVSSVPISVDTRKYGVMKAAFEAGADILNDISALEDDERLAGFAAETKIPVILMHKRGNPETMQSRVSYGDVVEEVSDYLSGRAAFAEQRGILSDRIIVDPGVGFAKKLRENQMLIANCGKLCGGKYPVLMALSRKTCIGEMTGRETADRLAGTLAADLFAVERGATLVRVHDVASCVDTLRVYAALKEVQDYEQP